MEQPTDVKYPREGFYSFFNCRTFCIYIISVALMYKKSVRQVKREIHSEDFVKYNNLWVIGERHRTRRCLSAAVLCRHIFTLVSFIQAGSNGVIKLIKQVPVSTSPL